MLILIALTLLLGFFSLIGIAINHGAAAGSPLHGASLVALRRTRDRT